MVGRVPDSASSFLSSFSWSPTARCPSRKEGTANENQPAKNNQTTNAYFDYSYEKKLKRK
jgi:hypothetical protein